MARRLNKKVNLVPPKRSRVTPGDVGETNVAEQIEGDIGEGDMAAIYHSIGDHAANIKAFARERIRNECIDISKQPDLQRHLAIMYLENSIETGAANNIIFNEEVTYTPEAPTEFTDSEQEFLSGLDRDLRSVGLDTIADASSIAPLTLNLMTLKNMPTRLCGSDVTMISDRVHELYAAGSLQEATALADAENAPATGSDGTTLDKWLIIWAIFAVYLVEFGLLFALKSFVGFFDRWPLKVIFNFFKSMIRKILRHIASFVFRIVLGQDREEADKFKELQIQQLLLFAGGANPLVTIGGLLGIV